MACYNDEQDNTVILSRSLTFLLCRRSRRSRSLADLVNGFYDGRAHFCRKLAAHGEAAEGWKDFLLTTKFEQFDDGETHFVVWMLFNSAQKRLSLVSLGHQEEEQGCVVSFLASLACKLRDGLVSEARR